ncbi:MAG: hypothetical protein R3Y12_00850 [Clostridia bacterium]
MSSVSSDYSSYYNNYGDIVFTDQTDNTWMDYESFLNLMILEIQNQDFMDTEGSNVDILETMSIISNMQMMEQMGYQMETSYAANMVGKVVTASRFTVSGDLDTSTGVVDKVTIYDGEYYIYIGGKTYTLDQIMEIGTDQVGELQTDSYSITASSLTSSSALLNWEAPTEDLMQSYGLTYSVYYTTEDTEFDTVAKVEEGTLVGDKDQKYLTLASITGLDAQTVYYANVVVTNTDGSKSVFQPVEFTTLIGSD